MSQEDTKIGEIVVVCNAGERTALDNGDLAIVTGFWSEGPLIIVPGKLPNKDHRLSRGSKGFGFYWHRFKRTGQFIDGVNDEKIMELVDGDEDGLDRNRSRGSD